MPPLAIVLAAGKSTRMKSALPKVLHEVCGRPMIEYVLDAARDAGATRIVVVVGHEADRVRAALASQGDVEFALQAEQQGTGHAVMMCREALSRQDGAVLVLSGDTPLLRAESLRGLLDEQQRHAAACIIGTAETDANQGLGRIVRDAGGAFARIVEQRAATPEQAAVREINTGCYAFDARDLLEALDRIRPENSQAEYY
ncbi:MAG TPA: NTP transferase domain-containing protein, partial [Planctomycetaceae bacterium]|nr:NTP transferase domain-containing protein [Planctomycetaceae bacterium]